MTFYPEKYQLLSAENVKKLNVIVRVQDLSTQIGMVPIYEKIRYGDSRLTYGLPGIVYGGLILIDDQKTLLMKEGLTITQKVEPEQGRGSLSTISLSFLDTNGFMTALCSPGVLLDEPLGNKLITVYLGYQNSSFPDDYIHVFRGYISKTNLGPGKVTLELSDANIKARQSTFYGGQNYLGSDIDNSQTNIPVPVTDSFFAPVLDIHGNYDWQLQPGGSFDLTKCVRAWIHVDDEFMEYSDTGIASNHFTVRRGGVYSRGSATDAHTNGTSVTNGIQIYGNVIDLILKIYLSGFGAPWIDSIPCVALGTTLDPTDVNNNCILFNVDVSEEYGITPGDAIIVTGSGAGNNGTYYIEEILDGTGGDPSRQVIVTVPLTLENPFPGTLAFRSQYDTLPLTCGLKNTPQDIDVAQFQSIKGLFYESAQYTLQLFVDSEQSGKDFIEQELFLPVGAYSVARNGRLSIAVTRPPFATEQLMQVDQTNVRDPQSIMVERALNTRRFYNLIQYNYDVSTDNQTFGTTNNFFDTISATKINITQLLPINSLGLRTFLGGDLVAAARGAFLLNRYKKAAYQITLKVNWKIGSQIEIGDMVIVNDPPGVPGALQISNLETGVRGLGRMLFEVIGRSLRIADGYADLTLLSSLGYTVEQRYAQIAPSSQVDTGTTSTAVRIKPSFGELYGANEFKKWQNFVGQTIRVHSPDYSNDDDAIFIGFDPTDPFKMLLNAALNFTPSVNDVVECDNYGTGTDPSFNAGFKASFAFIDPSLTVTSGTSGTVFHVSSGDAAQLVVGLPIFVRNSDWSVVSPEVRVTDVTGTTVTVSATLGFTPSAGEIVELVGFQDGGGAYRIL